MNKGSSRSKPRARDILGAFSLEPRATVRRFGTGLINSTYRVLTARGEFVLQRLHDVVRDEAVEDMRVVTEYLASHGMRVPRLIPAKDERLVIRDHGGGRWRLYELIPGRIVNVVRTPDMAVAAARIVGEMHRHLHGLAYEPRGSIPHFHDTAYVLDKLLEAISHLPKSLRTIAEAILATLPGLILTDSDMRGSKQVIHGDLKISNILFAGTDRAVGIIDFDTLLHDFRAVDLGDALRSWCNLTDEDDPRATFDHEVFRAAMTGYEQGWSAPVRSEDRQLFLRATAQIAYELASRFLIDVVEDHYFGYRKPYTSRRAANTARARGQYRFARTVPIR